MAGATAADAGPGSELFVAAAETDEEGLAGYESWKARQSLSRSSAGEE